MSSPSDDPWRKHGSAAPYDAGSSWEQPAGLPQHPSTGDPYPVYGNDPYAGYPYGQPPYGQPGYEQPGYGPGYGQPPYPPDPYAAYPPAPYGYAQPRNNGMAIASLICSIVGLTGLGFVLGPIAVVLGIVGLNNVDRDGGRGLAVAGIVIGALETLLTVALVLLFVGVFSAAVTTSP